MDALDALLALVIPDNLDYEDEVSSWEVTELNIDGDYIHMYTIITIEGKTIEITIQSTEAD